LFQLKLELSWPDDDCLNKNWNYLGKMMIVSIKMGIALSRWLLFLLKWGLSWPDGSCFNKNGDYLGQVTIFSTETGIILSR
jgi:hypothetical protein